MGSSTAVKSSSSYDLSFKILLIGDSGVGKSSLLLSFISNYVDDVTPTIGIHLVAALLKRITIFNINLFPAACIFPVSWLMEKSCFITQTYF